MTTKSREDLIAENPHLTPVQCPYDTKAALANLNADLKKGGLSARVTKQYGEGYQVDLYSDATPKQARAAQKIASKYVSEHWDGMQDLYISSYSEFHGTFGTLAVRVNKLHLTKEQLTEASAVAKAQARSARLSNAGRFASLSQNEKNAGLLRAAANDKVSDLKIYVTAGADVNVRNYRGEAALHHRFSRVSAYDILLKSKADPNTLDKLGRSPLLKCAFRGDAFAAEILLKGGAAPDVGKSLKHGQSTIHFAAGKLLNARLLPPLLRAGADVNARDSSGNTPLHYACNEEAAITLMQHGASLSAVNAEGRTAIDRVNNLGARAAEVARSFQHMEQLGIQVGHGKAPGRGRL
jgi:hypothetical protein